MKFKLYAMTTMLNIHNTHYYVITIILIIEIHRFVIITFLKTITVCNILTTVGNNIYGT